MKKIYFKLLALCLVLLTSCSKDDNKENYGVFIEIDETFIRGNSNVFQELETFVYNGLSKICNTTITDEMDNITLAEFNESDKEANKRFNNYVGEYEPKFNKLLEEFNAKRKELAPEIKDEMNGICEIKLIIVLVKDPETFDYKIISKSNPIICKAVAGEDYTK